MTKGPKASENIGKSFVAAAMCGELKTVMSCCMHLYATTGSLLTMHNCLFLPVTMWCFTAACYVYSTPERITFKPRQAVNVLLQAKDASTFLRFT